MKYIFIFLVIISLCLPVISVAQEADSKEEQLVFQPLTDEAAPEAALEPETIPAAIPETGSESAGIIPRWLIERINKESTMHFAQRLSIALAIIAGQALLIRIIWLFFKRLGKKVLETGGEKIKPLTIKKLRLLSTRQIIEIIHFLLKMLKYVITVFQLYITLPIVFSLFPTTENLAHTLFGYILTPLKDIVIGILKYIPNLITIIIIIVIIRYVLRALRFLARQLAMGKLVIPGFYADWAEPTYKILQVLLLAFTVAIVYPYLPGSDSRVFQGVSVFVGVVFSLGSSTAIGNLVAGLVITYMRPFKIGDRVQIKEITGFVVEKQMMVVRLKTHKNEYVTFPNLTILSSGIINYNTSSDEDEEGLILNTEITFGYATPWQTIHDILISAALNTEYVQKSPRPFVLQTRMDDFYAHYQINCYTKEVDRVPAIYARLYENIQNGFHEAGLDMTTPHKITIGGNEKK
jgi:small-conductance mechanosensitive channel